MRIYLALAFYSRLILSTMNKALSIFSAFGGLATLIIQIVSLATSVWIRVLVDSEVVGSIGLWHACTPQICFTIASLIEGKEINASGDEYQVEHRTF